MNKAIIKRSYEGIEEGLVFRNLHHGYYWPVTNCVSVFDREKDNIVIENGYYDPEDDSVYSIPREETLLPVTKSFTVNSGIIAEIKSLIEKSGVLKIRSFDSVDYLVLDGEANSIYFNADGKRKLIECDNFFMLYDGCDQNTNAGKVIKVVDEIEELLKREIKKNKD